ncbi:receptor-interacting serine/threonine-protein kinase 1 [Mastacembelus armatus]|uniref:Receptor (TNFRSF)-interacting serine-threonine kinase 1, like n=1 Tax=Mastacembelus armatus TaxID=205130 RepID=A0A3Q3MF95_9TELE|nr:receptor-interacting serine/threonine-protein kinase 1 [Mastacembelus armatus]XP_026170296.1 receptor-interacting serine/threonine-protein kinase 1 [Mastacembelus armatus]XP_026170297.1 receptor-interacting serine/threonine-protein kinase 1 [Mastacembelus armatus]
MATTPQTSLQMRSTDLIKKEPLDYGGFGEVYLCYHVTLGQVVMKTMYTGPLRSEESKRSLLEEGSIMASLNHERVVKLLGVIMEDRDCSLVMELIPRGNLLVMLETVNVPVSIKGRIILEILEGMVYLTQKDVIHKDIKPENILVDKDFHIKIADLGLATCQTWSRLTKEEYRRKSHTGRSTGVRCAGTLSYMAPEHLESINTASTEKSDVYSFAIVVWVILTRQEPYANARSEEQVCQCVRNGDRPAEDLIPKDTPAEIIQLMKRCWSHNPHERPTFKEGYIIFHPFYMEKLEPYVEEALVHLRTSYEGPDELVEKMKSLSVTHECFSADCPAPLMSSDKSVSVPIEASIEDLHGIPCELPVEFIQTDANGFNSPSDLDKKLHREYQYHIHGSYNCENPDIVDSCHPNSSNPLLQNHFTTASQPEQDRLSDVSSVHSWTKVEPVQPASQEEAWNRPTGGLYDSMNINTPTPYHLPVSTSSPSLSQFNQQYPHFHYDRQQSCPAYPVSDTSAPDVPAGRLLNPCKSGLLQDPSSLFIQNASGIQIGSNNTMSIRGYELPRNLSPTSISLARSLIKEGIQKNEDHPVTEEHLDLVRDNIGSKWKGCARRLGLTHVEIEVIEHDCFRDGLPEMVHQMLERWKMKEGSIGCKIGKLCRALQGNVKVDIIQKILDTCSSPSLMS